MKTPALLAAFLPFALAAQDSAPKRPRITGIAHIAIYAHDVAAARNFYQGLMGFAEPFLLNKPDGSLSMAFIKVNERQYIELSPEVEPATDRLNHIAVETDDAEAMRRYLAAKGFKVPDKVPTGRTGNLNFTIKDPDGHGVEFVQYTPTGWSVREKGKFLPADRVSTKMTHVGVIVGELEPSLKFYRDVLGFVETWRGSRDNKVLNWVNMRVPDGDTYVELMLHGQLPAPTARGTAHHLCLEVNDIERSKAWLEARPAAKSYTRPLEIRTGVNRRRQLNLYDPDGTRTELMEPRTVDGVPPPSATAPPPR